MPTNTPGEVCGEPANFWCRYAKDTCRDHHSSCCLPITPGDLNDSYVEMVMNMAIAAEDVERVDLCETILKMIVQPNLRKIACERLFEHLSESTPSRVR